MIRRRTVCIFGALICLQLLYYGHSNAREASRWTVVPILDIRVNSTHSLHGEQVPMLLNSQEQTHLRKGNSANMAQMAQASVNAVSRMAGAIAAALPQWQSIKATANDEATQSAEKKTSEGASAARDELRVPATQREPKPGQSLVQAEQALDPAQGEKEKELDPLPLAEEKELDPLPLVEEKEQGALPLAEEKEQGPLPLAEEKDQDPPPLAEEKEQGPLPLAEKKEQPALSASEKGKGPESSPLSAAESQVDGAGALMKNPIDKKEELSSFSAQFPSGFAQTSLPNIEEKEDRMTYRHAKSGKGPTVEVHGVKTKGRMTIVIMGYSEDRKENYHRLLSRYRGMCGVVAKIIVIWNNLHAPPPTIPEARSGSMCSAPVVVVQSVRNSLNNRFLVGHLIDTEAVFSVDDDFLFSQSMLRCLLRHWERDKDRIVGLHPRLVEISGTYNAEYLGGYNLILTGTAMFHARFLPLYASDIEVQEKVDSVMSGEDILFNAVSQNATGKAPLFVVPYENFRFKEFKKSSASGLHARYSWKQWLQERSDIAIWAQSHFSKTVFQLETKKGLCMSHSKASRTKRHK